MAWGRAQIALLVLVAASSAACMRTPDLVYGPDDAGPADAEPADDAADGDAMEQGDTGPPNTCPLDSPPGVTFCCGKLRCVGAQCNANRCDLCKLNCSNREVCCAHSNVTLCKPRVDLCP